MVRRRRGHHGLLLHLHVSHCNAIQRAYLHLFLQCSENVCSIACRGAQGHGDANPWVVRHGVDADPQANHGCDRLSSDQCSGK